MGYDDVIPLLGGFGRYQRRIYFLLCLPAIICAFHKLANVFLQGTPNYRCQLPNELANVSYVLPFEVLNASYPRMADGKFSSCSIYNEDKVVQCDNYIFDHSIYKSTTVTEWNLVCDKSYLKTLGDTIFMFGVMVGSIAFGALSDRFGRKIIFIIALVVLVVFGGLAAIAPEYWTFTISRAIVATTTSGGIFLVAYVIAMEMVGPSDRLVAGTICHMFFSMGYVLTAGFAYFITDWRYLQAALTLPGVVFFSYWWFIPESTRWLVSNNRIKEATKLIQVAAKENKVQVSNAEIEALLITDVKQEGCIEPRATILDIFKHPNLRKRSLIIFFDWFANNITYYGLSWNTSNLGGNDYINFVIAGAVEIPAYTFLLLTLNKWGRRTVLCGSMVVAGVALLLTAVVPQEPVWIIITLAMIGKLMITAGYGTVYIFSTEQFPTVIRNAGLGTCSTFARVGSILAPTINLTNEVWKPLPMVIFGVFAFIGGGLSLFLPETLNRELPETISDSENFSRNRKPQNLPDKKQNENESLKAISSNGINEEAKS